MKNRLARLFLELEGVVESQEVSPLRSFARTQDLEEKLNKTIMSYRARLLGLEEFHRSEKRKIRALLQEMGVSVKPGSELSKILRLDNQPPE